MRAKKPARNKPGVEMLEDRCLLTVRTVTTLADMMTPPPGTVTLRSALAASQDGDVINFAPGLTGAINLSATYKTLVDTAGVTIQGPGSGVLSVQGPAANSFTLLEVRAGATTTLSGLTLRGGEGDHGADGENGGGIFNAGTLTVQESVITGNKALKTKSGLGAGIYNSGRLTLQNSTLSANTISGTATRSISAASYSTAIYAGAGGGLFNKGYALLQGSTVTGNQITMRLDVTLTAATTTFHEPVVAAGGGGVFSDRNGTLVLQNSQITGNSVSGDLRITGGYSLTDGRGVFLSGVGGGVTTLNAASALSTTFDQNHAAGTYSVSIPSGKRIHVTHAAGGGLFALAESTTSLNACQVTNNTTTYSGGGLETYLTVDFIDPVLTLQSCTISGNQTTSKGGAVYSHGALTFIDSTIATNSSSGKGGGLYLQYGSTYLQNSLVTGNQAATGGGGIYNQSVLRITASTLSANTTTGGAGGALFERSASVFLQGSTISGNSAPSGGGLYNRYQIYLTTSLITGNRATTGDGGGIAQYNRKPPGANNYGSKSILTINDCTIAGNTAAGSGGGIFVPEYSILTATNCTIALNSASATGGGLFVGTGNQATIVNNTLIAENSDNTGSPDLAGAVRNGNNNLLGIAGGGTFLTGSGNLLNVNPLLGPLQNNGGPTRTLALLPGSPAIDAGNNTVVTAARLSTDQRGPGFNRVINAIVDIGAFEYQPPATLLTLTTSGTPSLPNQPVTFTATVQATAPGSNTPTGSVTFSDGSVPLATVTLSNGVATFTTAVLSVGSHTITAVYGGLAVGDYLLATSQASLTQVVGSAAPIVTGADAGGGPQVVLSNADGTVRASFFAFSAGFTGGVRVAEGDVNGDGTPDVIAAAGPGGGPQVTVFDGRTLQPILSFYAFASGFTGGVYIAVGDLNRDGFADIICGAGAGGGPQVAVFSGKYGTLLTSFYAFSPAFHGGVRVAEGDVNGDGVPDIIAAAGPGGGPQVTVLDGTQLNQVQLNGQIVASAILSSVYALNPSFTGGVFVASGDVNGDGRPDLICGAGAGGGPQVTIFDGRSQALLASFYALPASFTGGVRVGYGVSLGSGGRPAILTSAGPGAAPQVSVFDSATLTLLQSFYALNPGFSGGTFISG